MSIARVIEPVVATNSEPPKRLHSARLSVASGQHLRGEEIGEQDRLVAVRAEPAEADGAAEAVALRATWLAETALTAASALIDLGGPERSSAAERGGQGGQVSRSRVKPAEAAGLLPAGRRAVAGAGRDGAGLADWAAAIGRRGRPGVGGRLGAVTRTVTHGVYGVGIGRHRLAAPDWSGCARCLGARRAR